MNSTRRRTAGVTQAGQDSFSQFAHPTEVAQPIHSMLSGYDQTWTNPTGNFVHPDPLVDGSHDTLMAPPPANLSLSVPGAGAGSYTANTLLYSPASDYSQSQLQDQYILPSYDGSHLDSGNDNTGWQSKVDPSLSEYSPTSKARFNPLPDTSVKTRDVSASAQLTSNMNSKERTAHRKAIEEKSSMKRKLAEQRLSRAITSRLGGTFVPGLANQMNQAADIIERDAETIQMLEAELKRLRNNYSDVQMKFRN